MFLAPDSATSETLIQLPSVALRIKAGEMLVAGMTADETAAALGITVQTARRYKLLVEEGGIEQLKRMGVGGRKPSLDAHARVWLSEALRSSATVFGFESDHWTDGRLLTIIERQFQLRLSRVYARQLIIELGFADSLRKRRQPAPATGGTRGTSIGLPQQIADALRDSPRSYGLESDKWTNERLRIAIERRCGLRYSRTHVMEDRNGSWIEPSP
jgi:transposase